MWLRTNIEPAPHEIEVLLSDGSHIYLGMYDTHTDLFYDQNKFSLPTPKYWHKLPDKPE